MQDAWDGEWLLDALSERARRSGASYAGPGSGNDTPAGEQPPIAFTGGLPDPGLLPAAALSEATAAVLADDPNAALQYGGAQGWEGLREWLAAHWSEVDRTELSTAHFTLTNGSAGALVNICDTFLDTGDIAGVEAPSFPGSIRAIRSIAPRLESIAVDDDGLDVDELETRLKELEQRGDRMRLLYTIPNFQNPTGSTLPLERRERLLEICSRFGVLIVEDDAYGELYFADPPPPSLYALAGGHGVVKIGTFSKTVAPGFRVGWCQAIPRVVDALVATRSDMGISPLLIRVLERFARDGALQTHVERLRSAYEQKCRTTVDALDLHCAENATWNRPAGGFFVWVTLGDRVEPAALADAARGEKVTFVGGHLFFAEQHSDGPRPRWGPGDSPYLRLAFSYVAEDQIAEGIRRLGRAIAGAAHRDEEIEPKRRRSS